MDYGPSGNADVTENLTESVPCGPVVHDPAEPEQDSQSLPYLHIKTVFQSLDSPVMKEVSLSCELIDSTAATVPSLSHQIIMLQLLVKVLSFLRGSCPLACVVSMINSKSRGPDTITA